MKDIEKKEVIVVSPEHWDMSQEEELKYTVRDCSKKLHILKDENHSYCGSYNPGIDNDTVAVSSLPDFLFSEICKNCINKL